MRDYKSPSVNKQAPSGGCFFHKKSRCWRFIFGSSGFSAIIVIYRPPQPRCSFTYLLTTGREPRWRYHVCKDRAHRAERSPKNAREFGDHASAPDKLRHEARRERMEVASRWILHVPDARVVTETWFRLRAKKKLRKNRRGGRTERVGESDDLYSSGYAGASELYVE